MVDSIFSLKFLVIIIELRKESKVQINSNVEGKSLRLISERHHFLSFWI